MDKIKNVQILKYAHPLVKRTCSERNENSLGQHFLKKNLAYQIIINLLC